MHLKNDEALKYRHKTLNPSFDGVILDYMTKTLYENEQHFNEQPLKICKEFVMSSFIVTYMQKNHFLIHEVNQKIEAFQANGIMGQWIHRFTSYKHGSTKSTSSHPLAMKMENLRGAFDILLYGLLICFGCFVFEIVANQMRRKVDALIDFCTRTVLLLSL